MVDARRLPCENSLRTQLRLAGEHDNLCGCRQIVAPAGRAVRDLLFLHYLRHPCRNCRGAIGGSSGCILSEFAKIDSTPAFHPKTLARIPFGDSVPLRLCYCPSSDGAVALTVQAPPYQM